MVTNEEKKIIEKLKNKDMKVFRMVVDMYSKRLFYTIYRFTYNHDDTEDVIQEVWIKFFNNIQKFRGDSSIYSFLYRIAVNTSINWINKKKKLQQLTKILPLPSYNNTPMDEAIYNEEMSILKKGIDKLSKKQRSSFILHQEEKLSFKQIGGILEISENSAKVNYHYAVQKLKKYLIKEGLL